MWILTFFLSFFIAGTSFAKTCDIEFKKLEICGEIQFVKDVSRTSSSDFILKLTKKDKLYWPEEKLNIFLHMKMENGHEHGSSDVLVVKREKDFLIQDVWFLMNGLWQIHFEMRQDEKVLDKSIFMVCVGEKCGGECKIKMH